LKTTVTTALNLRRDGGLLIPSTINGSPIIVSDGIAFGGAALDLEAAVHQSIEWLAVQVGTAVSNESTTQVRFRPNYSGSPAQDQFLLVAAESRGSNNKGVSIFHSSSGLLSATVNDDSGSILGSTSASFAAVAGRWYDLEFNFKVGDTIRVFLDGALHSSAAVSAGTRTAGINWVAIGVTPSGATTFINLFRLDELLVYNEVQNTSAYTPPTSQIVGYGA